MLIPSTWTIRRTRLYISTRYILPTFNQDLLFLIEGDKRYSFQAPSLSARPALQVHYLSALDTEADTERLHVSIGINHSMVEDPALFLALGIGGFWIWVPKLVAAAVAEDALRLLDVLGDRTWRRGGARRAN